MQGLIFKGKHLGEVLELLKQVEAVRFATSVTLEWGDVKVVKHHKTDEIELWVKGATGIAEGEL